MLITVYDSSAKKNCVIKINTTNNTYVRTEGEITIPYQFIMGKTSDKLLSIHGISDLNGYNYTKPLTTGNGMFYNYTNYGIGTIQQILINTSGVHITDYIPVKTTDLSDTTDGMLVALLYKNNSSNATWYSISDLNYNILGREST